MSASNKRKPSYNTARKGGVKKAKTTGGKIARRPMQREVEVKGVDTALNMPAPILQTTGTNANAAVVNLIQQGTGSYNRIGRKIKMKSVFLNIEGHYAMNMFNGGGGDALMGANLRMVVVYDKQPSGILPTFDEIFGHTYQDGTSATYVFDSLKYEAMSRFRVIRNEVITIQPMVNPGTGDQAHYPFHKTFYIPLKGLETVYAGNANPATIAQIQSGGLYVYFRSDIGNTGAGTPVPGFVVQAYSFARLRYHDQ